jgi:hypothetical protein
MCELYNIRTGILLCICVDGFHEGILVAGCSEGLFIDCFLLPLNGHGNKWSFNKKGPG